MAVMRTASLGEFLKGLYATRSIPTPMSPHAAIATTSAKRTPKIFIRVPPSPVIGAKNCRPTKVPESTVMPTKEPIMKLSPWAKLMSSMMP